MAYNEDEVNDYIKNQFNQSPKLDAPIGPSSFDVSAMGKNLDDTFKMPTPSAPPPMSSPDMAKMADPVPPMPMPSMPKPATPTGAPLAQHPENVGSSHPGFTDDDLSKYANLQKSQIDKFGPEHEQAVMDDLRRKYHGIPNSLAIRGASMADGVMQGVARAGSSQFSSNLRNAEEKQMEQQRGELEHEGEANLKDISAKQSMDELAPNSTIGAAMLKTWGPLLDRMNISKEQQAKMVPALVSSVAPELVKDKDAMARIAMMKDQRNMQIGMRQDQFDQGQWVKLGNTVNALNAGSRKALGIAANNNMRADRAIESIDNPSLIKSPQLITQLVSDVAGIYKGGVPDEVSLKHSMYPTLDQDIAKLRSYLTSNPEGAATKALLAQIREQVLSLKKIDNAAIEKNLGISAVEFEPIIKKDPERWARMTGAVGAIEHGPEDKKAPVQGAGEVLRQTKDGKTAVFDASTKQFLRYQ